MNTRRDWDLVRQILILAGNENQENLVVDGFSKERIEVHVNWLVSEAHLINGQVLPLYEESDTRYAYVLNGLTWEGNNVLDAIQDQGTWSKLKAIANETSTSLTVDFIKEGAKMIGRKVLEGALVL